MPTTPPPEHRDKLIGSSKTCSRPRCRSGYAPGTAPRPGRRTRPYLIIRQPPRAAPDHVAAQRARPRPGVRVRRDRRGRRPLRSAHPPRLDLVWRAPDITGRADPRGRRRRCCASACSAPSRNRRRRRWRVTGARHSRRRDRQAISHHYDVGNDFYRIVLGAEHGLLLRVLDVGRAQLRPGRRAARQARPDLPQARPETRHAAARRGLRLGQPGDARGPRVRRTGARHHPLRPSRPTTPASRSPRPASPSRSRSGSRTTATSTTARSTRSPAWAWPSTSAPARTRSMRPSCIRQLKPGGRLLNHQIARLHLPAKQPRTSTAELHRRVRLPGRRTGAGRHDGDPAGGRRFRGTRRARAARALRPHAARLGGQPGGRLGHRGAPDQPRPGTGLAALHGRVGARLRAGADRRQPGAGRQESSQRRPTACRPPANGSRPESSRRRPWCSVTLPRRSTTAHSALTYSVGDTPVTDR